MLLADRSMDFGSQSVHYPRAALNLHCMLTSVGYECRTNLSYDWDGLKRGDAQFVLFQYTLAGQGELRYENRLYTVGPGQAMLLHFPHNNRYRLPPGSQKWEFIYLCLGGAEVMRLCHDIERVGGPVLTIALDNPLILLVRQLVAAARSGEFDSPYSASAAAYRFVMQLAQQTLPYETREGRPGEIERACAFCHAHYHEQIGVGDMADAAGCSRAHFSRLFKSVEGVSPAVFLRHVRIEQAFVLLRDTSLTIKEIGQRCGFFDTAHLNRVFRAAEGISPGTVRRSGMYARGAP